jgi:hypothetical protein
VRLEGLRKLKNLMTSSGIKPMTFWLEAVSQMLLCDPITSTTHTKILGMTWKEDMGSLETKLSSK